MLVEFSQGFNFDAIKTVGRLPSGLRPDKEYGRKTQKGKAGQAMAAKMIPVGSYQSLHIGPPSTQALAGYCGLGWKHNLCFIDHSLWSYHMAHMTHMAHRLSSQVLC